MKGTLRLLAVPMSIFEIPKALSTLATPQPAIGISTQGIVAFINIGKKGPSDPKPVNQDEMRTIAREDLTSYTVSRDEPLNEYVVSGNPPLLVRTKTVMLKVELFKNRFNVFGDPYLWVNHNTSHSVSEYKMGDLYSP